MRWLKTFLKEFKGEIILITHDRSFMDAVTTHTMGLRRKSLMIIEGNSEKYYAKQKKMMNVISKQKPISIKTRRLEDFVRAKKQELPKLLYGTK